MRIYGRLRSCVLVLALTLVGCYPSAAPLGLARGLWKGSTSDQEFVFEFTGSHIGVHATLHTLRDGRRVTEQPVFEVTFEAPRIEVWIDDDLSYRAQVDLDNGKMTGEILGLGVEPRQLELRRVSRSSLAGFLARPVPPRGKYVYHWSRPADTGDGWTIVSPEHVGLNRERLEETVSAVIAGEAGLLHSFLVVRDGKLVVEEYFHGYDRDDLHGVGMCALGVASLLTGIAVDKGHIPSLQTPVLDFFPKLREGAAEGWSRVSFEHVLTMTTGWHERREDSRVLGNDDKPPFAATFAVSPTYAPGSRFRYDPRLADLVTGVLESATGTRVDEIAAAHLFGPLGIETVEWNGGVGNEFVRLHDGLRLRPRDLAKLGQLVLDEGRWKGRQVVSAEWIRDSTTHQLDFLIAGDEQFGYLWWMPPLPQSVAEDRVIAARGVGSQFLYVIPSLDTVALITGGNHFNGKTFLPSEVLASRFLAAFEP